MRFLKSIIKCNNKVYFSNKQDKTPIFLCRIQFIRTDLISIGYFTTYEKFGYI